MDEGQTARETQETEAKKEKGRGKWKRQGKETLRQIKDSDAGDYLCDESCPFQYTVETICFCSLLFPQHPAVPDTQDTFVST